MPATPDSTETGTLFETYHDRIYRYILRLVKNAAEAEDLTQETFLRAYRRRDSLRDPDAVRGWLYSIATHVCLDRLRQLRPQVSIDSRDGTEQVESAVSRSPSALEITERMETSGCVQRCLDRLPDNYRAVLLLHYAHSLTAAEIANLLGLTVTTVKIRLHRARRKLQEVCAVSTSDHGFPVCEPKS